MECARAGKNWRAAVGAPIIPVQRNAGADLSGAPDRTQHLDHTWRYRPRRLTAAELLDDVTASFSTRSGTVGPVPVLDVSTCGVGLQDVPEAPAAGGRLLDLHLEYRGRAIFEGTAFVVYRRADRVGLRLATGVIDVDALRLEDRLIDRRLTADLEDSARCASRLPAEWRAAIADLRQLLQRARDLLDDAEQGATATPWWRPTDGQRLVERVWRQWSPAYYEALTELDALSARLGSAVTEEAEGYARRALRPLLDRGPVHARAARRPNNTGCDYRVLALLSSETLCGSTWFSQLLHLTARRYQLGRALQAREKVLRDAIVSATASGPARILALCPGPALELERYLWTVGGLASHVGITLASPDTEALEYAHDRLMRCLVERHRSKLPVRIECVKTALRRMLEPGDLGGGFTLIYAPGVLDVLDEPAAARTMRHLWSHLSPGGRLLMGNLDRVPETDWLLRYVLGWRLRHRSADDLLRLAASTLRPIPADLTLTRDPTGYCHILDARA